MEAKIEDNNKSGSNLPLFLVQSGDKVTVVELSGGQNFRQKIIDMGVVPGQQMEVIVANRNQPFIVKVNGTRLMIGYGMVKKILVQY